MAYEIIRNDITKVSADAIVNTANPRARIGAGTDTAIHKAAGPELLEARKKIGDIAPGQVGVTPAFNLKAKYVIHTVGPVWQGGNAHEEEILRSAYDNALRAALNHGCESIAFPLMAAGSYGFPKEKAMSIAISAFTDFLMAHEMRIILVLFNKSVFELAGHLFDDLRSYVDENYVAQARAEEYGLNYNQSRYNELEEIYRRRDLRRRQTEEKLYGTSPNMVPVKPSMAPQETLDACLSVDGLDDLDEMVKAAGMSFHQTLFKIIDEKGMTDPEVYNGAVIKKQQFSKIRSNPDYQPTKSAALKLAIALHLDYEGAIDFLAKAGYTLSRSNITDIVLEYCFKKNEYRNVMIDMMLADRSQPPLFNTEY